MKYRDLYSFVENCEDILEGSIDILDDIQVLICTVATKDEILEHMSIILEEYYFWLGQAIKEELYAMAAIIRNTIAIELKHYKGLTWKILKVRLNTEIDVINDLLKNKYLPHA